MAPKPIADVSFDGMHHWPEFGDKGNRFRVSSRYWAQSLYLKKE